MISNAMMNTRHGEVLLSIVGVPIRKKKATLPTYRCPKNCLIQQIAHGRSEIVYGNNITVTGEETRSKRFVINGNFQKQFFFPW